MFSSNKCVRCEGKLKDAFSFCPYCGLDLRNPQGDMSNYGMLGRNDKSESVSPMGGLGITDKMISSIFNSLMKSMESQMKNIDQNNSDNLPHEVQRFPNGIRIKIGNGSSKSSKPKKSSPKVITNDQVKRMSNLPRGEARADVRRFSDRVVYELKAPGVESVEDIFVSKLENGYEVKAIGKNKVYVNTLPVSLPLKKYFLKDRKLHVEFGLQ